MHLTGVTLPVADLDEAERFYVETLGLPAQGRPAAGQLIVQVGATALTLTHVPGSDPCDHVAFTVPADAFDAARRWLDERTDLLEKDDQDEFEGPPGWDSRSLYVAGPSRSVVELIARRRLDARLDGHPFGPEQLLAVSEVGIAVADVPAAVATLEREAGLLPFAAPGGIASDADFAAVGDDDGLLILAARGRPWLPTRDRRATSSGLVVTAVAGRSATLTLGRARVATA